MHVWHQHADGKIETDPVSVNSITESLSQQLAWCIRPKSPSCSEGQCDYQTDVAGQSQIETGQYAVSCSVAAKQNDKRRHMSWKGRHTRLAEFKSQSIRKSNQECKRTSALTLSTTRAHRQQIDNDEAWSVSVHTNFVISSNQPHWPWNSEISRATCYSVTTKQTHLEKKNTWNEGWKIQIVSQRWRKKSLRKCSTLQKDLYRQETRGNNQCLMQGNWYRATEKDRHVKTKQSCEADKTLGLLPQSHMMAQVAELEKIKNQITTICNIGISDCSWRKKASYSEANTSNCDVTSLNRTLSKGTWDTPNSYWIFQKLRGQLGNWNTFMLSLIILEPFFV